MSTDIAWAVQTDSAGNIYLAGASYPGNGTSKVFVAKISPLGSILWDTFIEAPGRYLAVNDMVLSESGDLYICGISDYSAGESFYAKVTGSGTLVYCKILGGGGNLISIANDPSTGGIVLADYNGRLIAISADGSVRWALEDTSWSSWPWGICTDAAGFVYPVFDMGSGDFGVAKFDPSGNLVRQRVLVTSSVYEWSWDVTMGSDGYIYALGEATSVNLLLVSKLTTGLDVIWCEMIGDPSGIQQTTKIMEAADGTLYSVGLTWTDNVSNPAVFHIDRSGNVLDAVYYTGGSGSNIMFNDATPMRNGGIVVAGASFGVPQTTAYPIPGVTVTPVTDGWEDQPDTWASVSVTTLDAGAFTSDPAAAMDDFSTDAQQQAWFGMIDTRPSTLVVDITLRQHGSDGERASLKVDVSNGTLPYVYSWDFGDGTTANGQRVTHTYSASGLYSARVMVTDAAGEFGFDTVQVMVSGPPQIFGISVWPSPALLNQSVAMSVSAVDYGGSIVGYYWDFGDGTSVSTTESSTSHIYTSEGLHNMTVIVTDDTGDTASSGTTVQVVAFIDIPPVAWFYFSPDNPIEGQTVFFDGGPSYDQDGYIVEYQWAFGNGMYANGPFVSTVYSEAGYYTATLTVYDNYWVASSVNATVVVEAPPPVPADQYEPDDVWSNATSISVGGMQVHTISGEGTDVDWVTFTLSESAGVVVETSGVTGDTFVCLYNSTFVPGVPAATDDDGGQGSWSKLTLNLTAGQYWVRVNESGEDQEIASYTIQVRIAGEGLGWTLIVYMDADNNLEYAAFDDFLEMSSIGSTAAMNIVVQFDRIGWDSEFGGWSSTKRFYVTNGMVPTPENALMDMGELNMGSQDVLADFIAWSMSNYPADNYMLLMWDHGGGWDGAVCWDDTNGDVLSLEELENALNISSTAVGDRIDSVAFDACLMAMAEVTYSVRDWTDVLVYSEEVMWTLGLPYDTILADLAADPTMGTIAFANCIVSRYMEYYGWGGIETISAVEVAATGPLFAAIDALGTQLMECLDAYRYEIESARNSTTCYYDPSYIDLYDLADELTMWLPNSTVQPALDDVRDAISAAVFAEGHGSSAPGSHGLSIYFPMWSYLSSYDALDWSQDLSWADFLKAYNSVEPAEPDAYEPDDTYLEANPIALGEWQNHSIDEGGLDVDWVTFTLYNQTTIMIRTSAPWGVWADTVLYLYDSYGVPDSPIAWNDDGWGNMWSVIEADLAQGTYYAMVESFGNSGEIADYWLELVEGSANAPPVIVQFSYDPAHPGPYDWVYFYVGAYDPDGYINEFGWDFGDGTSSWSWYNSISHYYTYGGLFNVTVTVVDNMGGMATATIQVAVSMPPVAVITATPEVGKVGSPVTFSGAESYDPDGNVTAYYWYFDDETNASGDEATGVEVTHAFSSAGTYQVSLMVVDNNGQWGSTSMSYTVVNPLPPVAIVSFGPARPLVGQTVTFDGSYSVDPDGVIPTFIWEFGDGAVATGMVVTHAYANADDYVVKLTVIDEDGLSDDDATAISVVSEPVAAFERSPVAPQAGQPVTFYAYGSYDELGIVQYVWSFGDGIYAMGWQVEHAYSNAGEYQVTLTVTNAAGLLANITKTVSVSQALGPQSASEQGPSGDGLTATPLMTLSGTQATVLMCVALAGIVVGVEVYRRRLGRESGQS